MITTQQTAFRLLRSIVGLALVAAGMTMLLSVAGMDELFAGADFPDPVRWVIGALLLGNGALLVIPELTFVGTIVPSIIAFMLLVTMLRVGAWPLAVGTFAVLVGLACVAWLSCPLGLRRVTHTPARPEPRGTSAASGWRSTTA